LKYRIDTRLAIFLLTPLLMAGSCRNRDKSTAEQGIAAVQPTQGKAAEKGGGEALPEAEKESPKTGKVEEVMDKKYEFSLEEKKWLMKLAKDAVKAAVNGKPFDPPEPPTQILKEKGAAFVTLRENGELRGCIGHIIAMKPLYKCIAEVARSAALEDPRFPDVTPKEYDSLHFEISVLTPPQEVKDPKEIVVGKDGVLLDYGRMYHGVFLPQVPTEQGWDLVEYLDNLCYKAGLYKKGCWKDPEASLSKFQAVVWEEEDVK
jgi:AmmeMemoRadiSam system protein A